MPAHVMVLSGPVHAARSNAMSLSAEELARLTQVRQRTTMDGVPIVPDPTHFESSDPARNEAATIARWKDIVEAHGAIILGTYNVPTRPVTYDLGGLAWKLHLMDTSGRRKYSVPTTVRNRARGLKADNVPLIWWIWGDEQLPDVDSFLQAQPGTSRRETYARYQDRLEQLRRMTAPRDMDQSYLRQALQTPSIHPPVLGAPFTFRRDPLLIGVMPTATEPVWRGAWVLVGQWFD